MWICDHRFRRVEGFDGPRRLVCKLLKCFHPRCSAPGKTFSPEAEARIAHPRWIIDGEVFAWIGQRRFSEHGNITQLRHELADTHAISLSDAVLQDYIDHDERMLAARHQDPVRLAQLYTEQSEVRLSIDGLQPEMGHETLYVVRELNASVVWFAAPLLSSAAPEVERLFVRAREIAAGLGKPVGCWISDKQDAFLTGIAKVFPGVPHRLCKLHFVRGLAAQVTAQDSHVKVQMRKKVRGLADIERQVLASGPPSLATTAPPVPPPAAPSLPTFPTAVAPSATPPASEAAQTQAPAAALAPAPQQAPGTVPGEPPPCTPEPCLPESAAVVLTYCSAVRGILHDDQGSALHPTGLRMASALAEVSASLSRCLVEKKDPLPTRS